MSIPVIGVAYTFFDGLVAQATRPQLRVNPTIASGDFKVSIDGGAFNNLATLPDVFPAGGRSVRFQLSASEMNGQNIIIVASDASGAEWDDKIWNLATEPVARVANLIQIDGLATNGNNATLYLKSLDINNNAGSAIRTVSSGGNGHGILAIGHSSSGAGMFAQGGNTTGTYGVGIWADAGINSAPVSNGSGFVCRGSATGSGIVAMGPNGILADGSNNGGKNDFVGDLAGDITGIARANLVQIDGLATTGNNATLNLKKMSIVNGDFGGVGLEISTTLAGGSGGAVKISGTGGGNYGLSILGNYGLGITSTAVGADAIALTGGFSGFGVGGTFRDTVKSNLIQIDGLATTGNNATLKLKSLDIKSNDKTISALSIAGCQGISGNPDGGPAITINGGNSFSGTGGYAGDGVVIMGGVNYPNNSLSGYSIKIGETGATGPKGVLIQGGYGRTPVSFVGDSYTSGLVVTGGYNWVGGIDANIRGVITSLSTDSMAEIGAVPADNASPLDKLAWLFTLSKNKIIQTGVTQTVRNGADTATVGTATLSDDTVTSVRGNFS